MENQIMLWQGIAPDSEFCGDQCQPSLTAYPVEGARGAVVVCPGGAYAFKAADHEGEAICRMLNQSGIAAYRLDYRVAPCCHDTPLNDAKRAIRTVRAMGYEKVGILGFSAGGNLCCSAATLYDTGDPEAEDPIERISSRPDAFVPCYAVASFGEFAHLGSVKNLLGDDWQDEALRRRFSAECQVTQDTPPAFIWHTADDDAVPVQNSLLLAKALADHHVRFELHVYPHGPHGLGLAPEYPAVSPWARDCVRFLTDMGFGK